MRRAILAVLLLGAVAAPAVARAGEPTTVRVFQIRHCSVSEAAAAVQVLLTESGSVTVQPHQSRITVQDRADVVERAAEVIAGLDRSPDRYLLEALLLEGVARELPAAQRAKVDPKLRRMFPFVSYRRIGATTFDGVMGEQASADLGEGLRVSFLADSLAVSGDTPYGIPNPGNRLHLEWLTLERLSTDSAGRQRLVEVLRTSVFLSEKQEVIIGAGSSEESERGLVLILQARSIGAE